jgi:hypothetical protein
VLTTTNHGTILPQMTLEITLDEAAEEVTLVLDNHLVLNAYRENETIIFGRGFSKIGEDDIYFKAKQVCKILLTSVDLPA